MLDNSPGVLENKRLDNSLVYWIIKVRQFRTGVRLDNSPGVKNIRLEFHGVLENIRLDNSLVYWKI